MRNRILEDLKIAMKAQDKDTLAVIRMVKGAITLEEIDKKRELEDSEVINIISKQIKTRKESLFAFEQGGRQDLVEQTNKEIEILNKYMPEQLSDEEVNKVINDIFSELNPTGMADMGKIMNLAKEKLSGQADMSYVSKTIREKLSSL